MKTRRYYIHIRTEALKDADGLPDNGWKRALLDLAHAADVLDAFTDRCTLKADHPSDDKGDADWWKDDDKPEPPATLA